MELVNALILDSSLQASCFCEVGSITACRTGQQTKAQRGTAADKLVRSCS